MLGFNGRTKVRKKNEKTKFISIYFRIFAKRKPRKLLNKKYKTYENNSRQKF